MFSKKGFTLIELAIVLVVLGLLLASGIGIISILVKNQKFNESKAVVNKVCKAIEGYAISHKKLPSSLDLLGVPTKDPYTNNIIYAFAPNMETLDFCSNEPSSWLTLNDHGVSKNIAFIVYSKGANMHDETKTGTNSYQIKPYGTDVGSYKYDDVVCFGDINLLREKGCQAFEIITTSLPEGIQYLPYSSVSFQISGGILNNCSLNGTLPNGITFDSVNCSISGTPTQAGTFNFSITATDTIGRNTTKSFNLTINPNPVKITTPYLPYGYKDNSYSIGLTAQGGTGNYSWSISGTLPTGLSFSNGIISGTPTQTGTFSLTISACDINFSSVCDSKTFSLTVLDNVVVGSNNSGGGSGSGSGSGSTGSAGGSSGCSPPNCLYIVNKDNTHSYKINPTGQCKSFNYGATITLNLTRIDENNDRFMLYYRVRNCANYRLRCDPVIKDIIKKDKDKDGYVQLEKVKNKTKDTDDNCKFKDY